MKALTTGGFYLAVVVIVVVAVFPFYYAIITSFKTGTSLFEVNYWPTEFNFGNYIDVMRQGEFPRNILNSVLVASLTVAFALLLGVTASYALARHAGGAGALPRADVVAADHPRGIDVPADRGAGGPL